jgi:hypothetical protein
MTSLKGQRSCQSDARQDEWHYLPTPLIRQLCKAVGFLKGDVKTKLPSPFSKVVFCLICLLFTTFITEFSKWDDPDRNFMNPQTTADVFYISVYLIIFFILIVQIKP